MCSFFSIKTIYTHRRAIPLEVWEHPVIHKSTSSMQTIHTSLMKYQRPKGRRCIQRIPWVCIPTLYQPSFGALDTRGYEILKHMGKTIVMWSAGANGWWFLDNNQPIETTVAALRYTVPEAGGILELPTAAVVEAYLDDVWPYW